MRRLWIVPVIGPGPAKGSEGFESLGGFKGFACIPQSTFFKKIDIFPKNVLYFPKAH